MFRLPKLYPIIDRATLDARHVGEGEFAAELAAAGVTLVQYRDKVHGPREVLRAAAEIAEAFAGVEATLVMNDRADLAALLGWGVHVGQEDLALEDVRRVLGDGALIGLSTHNEKQVLRYAQDDNVDRVKNVDGPDYIAIGPVFRTSTKADAEPVVGLEGVRRARALTRRPLVAIGGITRENCRSAIEAGADSVAVIGGLFVEGMSVEAVARDFLRVLG